MPSSCHEKEQELFGFGTNYFHALGGTKEIDLAVVQSSDGVDESTEGLEATVVKAQCISEAEALWNDKNTKSGGSSDSKEDAILQIACSATSSIFLTRKGHIYQSGTLHGQVWTSPTKIEVRYPRKCVEIAAGRHFCLGRLEGGIGVISWGAGHFGQLGLGHNVMSKAVVDTPQIIPHLLPQALGSVHGATRVEQVAAGAWHALALLDNGKVMAWGSNRKFQCGIKKGSGSGGSTGASSASSSSKARTSTTTSSTSTSGPTIAFPQPMEFSGSFQKIACGRLHSMGIEKDTGRVYTWGANHYGQCGQHTSRRSSVSSPKLVEAMQKVVVVDVCAGDVHSLALTGGGRVFVWGSGMDGQLGLGGVIPISSRPKLLADLDFVAIEAGREWKQKQLDQQQQQHASTSEPHFREFNASPLPTTTTATATTLPDKKSKHAPPLSNPQATRPPSTTAATTEDRLSHLSSVPKIVQIRAAGSYSVAVSSSGHVYTWGYNDGGQLGIPESFVELPLVEATSSMMKQSSSGRLLQIRTFESSHNVLLPRRLDALANFRIDDVAVGTSNMWCMGTRRSDEDINAVVGRTLYEAQEERRRRGLWRLRKHLSSSASVSSASDSKSPIIVSIKAISKDDPEEVVIPQNVYTHAESTGMDEDGGSTTTFETQLSTSIVISGEGEQQSPALKTPPIKATHSLESQCSQASTKLLSLAETPPPGSPSSLASKTPPSTPNSLVTKKIHNKEKRPENEGSPNRESGKSSKALSMLLGRSNRKPAKGKGQNESEEELPPPENQQANGLPYSPVSGLPSPSSASPFSYAGGRPTLPGVISPSRRAKNRSQSVPSRRSGTPPPDANEKGRPSTPPPDRSSRFASSMSVSKLMRGRRNPKGASKGETAKKGRVRKAFDCAFGK